jgi:DNA-binding response OmpR family regulator
VIKKRVLLVEDDNAIRECVKQVLEIEGYHVDCAANGDEAIRALRCNDCLPGLILLDMTMPVKDGFQFREEQGQDSKWALIPVLIMTADGRIEEKTVQVGAQGFIKKPCDIDHIVKMVRQHCL